MNVIVAGSRNFEDFKLIDKALCRIFIRFYNEEFNKRDINIISGCARGVDTLGEKFANKYNLNIIKKPADWDEYGKSAGYIRNVEMGREGDVLIAFWDMKSRGTRHMINIANDLGKKVFVIDVKRRKILEDYKL